MPEIILCGSEGEQFLFENTLSSVGADDKRRGSVVLTAGHQMYRQFASGYADFWVHARIALSTNNGGGASRDFVEIISGTTVLAALRAVTTSSNLVASVRYDSQDVGPIFPSADDVFVNYDIRVQVSGGNTTVSFYRNEVLRHRRTYASALLPNAVMIQAQTDSAGGETYVQDVIITDALPTVGMELATMTPSAVGSYDDFVNDYTALDDVGYDSSTTISSTTPGDRESWFFADPEFNLGNKVIYGVAMTTVAQSDLADVVTDFEPFLRISAVNYAGDDLGADNVAPNAFTTVWTANPATTAPWEVVELTGLEAGIRAV